jgi:hypothetical protein
MTFEIITLGKSQEIKYPSVEGMEFFSQYLGFNVQNKIMIIMIIIIIIIIISSLDVMRKVN